MGRGAAEQEEGGGEGAQHPEGEGIPPGPHPWSVVALAKYPEGHTMRIPVLAAAILFAFPACDTLEGLNTFDVPVEGQTVIPGSPLGDGSISSTRNCRSPA